MVTDNGKQNVKVVTPRWCAYEATTGVGIGNEGKEPKQERMMGLKIRFTTTATSLR